MNQSPRRHIARRAGAAGMALAAMLVLTACRACPRPCSGAYNGYTRGGYIEGGNVQVES